MRKFKQFPQHVEFAAVACTVGFDGSVTEAFDFGDVKVDLASLCSSRIFLPAARHTAALLVSGSKVAARTSNLTSSLTSQSVEQVKHNVQSEGSRTESAANFLSAIKRWVEACFSLMCSICLIWPRFIFSLLLRTSVKNLQIKSWLVRKYENTTHTHTSQISSLSMIISFHIR